MYILSKDEGGRHTPFFNGYRPQFYFRTTDVTGSIELPAGTEGSAVRRNLVRNALVLDWSGSSRLPRKESRPMRAPDGANPERLRLIGWVEDAAGRILASAATVCGG